jgi:hypothetical protein
MRAQVTHFKKETLRTKGKFAEKGRFLGFDFLGGRRRTGKKS